MMTNAEIGAMLDETGYVNAYHMVPEGTALPSVTFETPRTTPITADNKILMKATELEANLYLAKHDSKAIKKVSDVLEKHGIIYSLEEEILDDEKLYIERFNMEV